MGIIPILPWLGVHFPKLFILSNIPLNINALEEVWLPSVLIRANSNIQLQNTGISLLFYLYFVLASIQTIRLLWSSLSVALLWIKSDKRKVHGLNIAVTPKSIPVFSFLNWVFIDKDTFGLQDVNLILAHEKLHIDQKHTWDLLLGELLRIFLWFNPFIHLIIKEVKANHEFLADISVTQTSGKISSYQNLLIQLSTTVDFNILTHNFSYSLIKRRINMIKKPKRSMRRFSLYSLTTLALAGVFVTCSANPKQQKSKKITVTVSKTMPANSEATITTNVADDNSHVFKVVDKMPKFPGGIKALISYLAKNIHYPAKAKKQGIQGRVYVHFIVNKDGSVSDVKILRGISPECDAEAIRVVKNMPNWIPGEQKGQKVRVVFNLPIKFSLK